MIFCVWKFCQTISQGEWNTLKCVNKLLQNTHITCTEADRIHCNAGFLMEATLGMCILHMSIIRYVHRRLQAHYAMLCWCQGCLSVINKYTILLGSPFLNIGIKVDPFQSPGYFLVFHMLFIFLLLSLSSHPGRIDSSLMNRQFAHEEQATAAVQWPVLEYSCCQCAL